MAAIDLTMRIFDYFREYHDYCVRQSTFGTPCHWSLGDYVAHQLITENSKDIVKAALNLYKFVINLQKHDDKP